MFSSIELQDKRNFTNDVMKSVLLSEVKEDP